MCDELRTHDCETLLRCGCAYGHVVDVAHRRAAIRHDMGVVVMEHRLRAIKRIPVVVNHMSLLLPTDKHLSHNRRLLPLLLLVLLLILLLVDSLVLLLLLNIPALLRDFSVLFDLPRVHVLRFR